MHNKVAILIVFFNKLSQTIECIDSFLPSGEHIYILNNASDDASWKALQEKYKHNHCLHFFHSDTNLGPAGGRNLLIDNCTEDWIFLVDNDVCIEPANDWKSLFDEALENKKDASVFCPKIFNVHDNSYATPHQFIKTNGQVYLEEAAVGVTNYFSCCGVIIHRNIFQLHGNFDSELFAFEDYEFSIRALCSPMGELKVFPLPEITLIHHHQAHKNTVDKKAVLERYNENRIEASMQRLEQKHQIKFEHEWKGWTKKQVANMTKNINPYLGRLTDTSAKYSKNVMTTITSGLKNINLGVATVLYILVRLIFVIKNFSIHWDISVQLHTLTNFLDGKGISLTVLDSQGLGNSLYTYHSSGLVLILSPIYFVFKNVLISLLILNVGCELLLLLLILKTIKALHLPRWKSTIALFFMAFTMSPFAVGFSADILATVFCLWGIFYFVSYQNKRSNGKLLIGIFLLSLSYLVKYSFLPFTLFPLVYKLCSERFILKNKLFDYVKIACVILCCLTAIYFVNISFVGLGTKTTFNIGDEIYFNNLRKFDGFLFHFGNFDYYIDNLIGPLSGSKLTFRNCSLTISITFLIILTIEFINFLKGRSSRYFQHEILVSTVSLTMLIIGFLLSLSLVIPPNLEYINWTYVQETRYYSPIIISFNLFMVLYFTKGKIIYGKMLFLLLIFLINVAAFRSLIIGGNFGDDFFKVKEEQRILLNKLMPKYNNASTVIIYSESEKNTKDFYILRANGFLLLSEADNFDSTNLRKDISVLKLSKKEGGEVFFTPYIK